MRLKLQIAIGCLAGLWWVAVPASAQVEMGGLNVALNGNLGAGYSGSMSDPGQSGHGTDIIGSGFLRGYYYNPNFLSFSVQPTYGRSQENSESQGIFDGGGVTASANFFSGSHFPGTFSYFDNKNSTGTFGIPGVAGLVTKSNSHGLNIGWSALIPGLPTLSLGFGEGSGSSSLVGSDSESHSSQRTYTLRSTYKVAGFDFGGGVVHQNFDVNLNGTALTGIAESTKSNTTTYSASAAHRLPFNGYFNSYASRQDYNDSFSGGNSTGTTNNFNATANFNIKVPVTISTSYTTNLFGSEQQYLNSQGVPFLQNNISPKSSQFDVNATARYGWHNVAIVGYVNNVHQSVGPSSFSSTQFGGTASYDFGKIIHGLIVTAGVTNTATEDGNQRAALVGNVIYLRRFGRWDFNTSFSYDQSSTTVGIIYTTSTLGYSAAAKYEFSPHTRWSAAFTGGKTGFVEQAGSGMHNESFSSTFQWRRFTASGTYSESNGTSVFGANGLVGVAVPIVPLGATTNYNAIGKGGGFGYSPFRRFTVGASYTRVNSTTMSLANLTGNSENESDQMSARLDYQFRKVYFYSGYIRLRQIITAAGTSPTSVTTYYFGLSRWFNFF